MTQQEHHGRATGTIPVQMLRFILVGALGTALYVGLFWALSQVMGSQLANVISWVSSTLLGNLGHRRFTYGVTGGQLRGTDGLVTFGTALAELGVSSLLLAIWPGATSLEQSGMVVLGTMIGGCVRFALNHVWFARTGTSAIPAPAAPEPAAQA
ncbi:MAG: GtrA family protein [Dermatophilaceae bacterium]